MAEECINESAATSSSLYNWWPDLQANSISSWGTNNPWSQQNNSSNSSCEEDVSMFTTYTNVSNQSGISVESSRRLVESVSTNELVGETGSDNQNWSHVVLTGGSSGELQNSQDVGENLVDEFSSKNFPIRMFDPPYDYLKKMDNGWDFTSSLYLNCTNKQLNESSVETERLSKLSNSVCNHQFGSCSCNTSLSSILKHSVNSLMSSGGNMDRNFSSMSCRNGHEMKVENIQGGSEARGTAFPRLFSSSNGGTDFQMSSYIKNTAVGGDRGRYHSGLILPDTQWNDSKTLADLITFSSYSNKPLMDVNSSKSHMETLNLSDSKKREFQSTIATSSTVTRSNGRAQRIRSEGKKKRSEESSGTVVKKPMLQHPTVSSTKTQVPKVKLTEKITTLQQIVSPFGKTDTASVLWEAICCVKFLQGQIQLLSNPYMKSNPCKDPWGGVDRGDMEADLRSRAIVSIFDVWCPLSLLVSGGSRVEVLLWRMLTGQQSNIDR
ncbi:basic helix-loop-helix (bHLH) DNA-binding superfamily protein [Forsythia ovata]|uniref:Basic helix-loop-helix (BHLH) DNA-binding superfamily protein n=1 Tax=Forsythia ovata TaxID=205694 RepID=A0ABD1X705_9LAMI